MNWRSTLGLIVIFVVLLFAYWATDWWKERQQVVKEEVKKLFSFEPSAVREIHIQQAGKPRCVGKKNIDGKWEFVEPSPDIPAFSMLWDRVAKHFAEIKNQRTITTQTENIATYGLDKPTLRFKAVVDGFTEPIELHFGVLDPTNTYRYAMRIGENTIFLVDDKQFFELNRSLEDLRFRFLVNDREVPLVRIEYARIWTEDDEGTELDYTPQIGEESIVLILERETENAPWYIQSPSRGLADQESVNALASEIQYGMGRDFIDNPENLADYGLQPPRCRLTYYDAKHRQPQTLFLGGLQTAGQSTQEKDKEKRKRLKLSECTGVFAKFAGQKSVFLIDPHILQLLPKSPESFRNRKIITRDMATLKRVERREGDQNVFVLEKTEDKGWVLTYPLWEDVDSINISNYLGRLKEVEVQSFPGGTFEERGLDKTQSKIRLTWEKGDSIELCYAPVPGDELHAYITQDTGEVGMVTNDVIAQIWVQPEQFKSLSMYKFAIAELKRVGLSINDKKYVFEPFENNWRVIEPENMTLINQGDLLRFLRYLSNFSAVEVNYDKELESKFDQPILMIEVKVDEKSSLAKGGTVTVGSPSDTDSRYRWAKKSGKEGYYLIRQELVDLVRDLERSIKPVDSGEQK